LSFPLGGPEIQRAARHFGSRLLRLAKVVFFDFWLTYGMSRLSRVSISCDYPSPWLHPEFTEMARGSRVIFWYFPWRLLRLENLVSGFKQTFEKTMLRGKELQISTRLSCCE